MNRNRTPMVASRTCFAALLVALVLGPGRAALALDPVEDSLLDDRMTTQDCLLEPQMVIDLSSPVPGVIARVRVDRGDTIRKGQILVELRSEVERSMIDLHNAQVEFGNVTAARNQELFEQRLISTQEKDEIELESKVSALELAAAQARLEQKIIVSPINGVVVERMMDPGEYVGEAPILKLANLDPLYVEALLPRERFGQVHPGMEAELKLAQPVGGTHRATVSLVDPVIDAGSGTFGVRLILPNPKNRIPAGLRCDIHFLTDGAN